MSKMPPIQLFNLADDPGETNNLQAEHPDRVAKIKDMLSKIINNGRSTPGPQLQNDAGIVMVKPIPKGRPKTKAEIVAYSSRLRCQGSFRCQVTRILSWRSCSSS